MKRLVIFSALALFMASCANTVDSTTCINDVSDAGGFWWGLWNGMTMGFSFIGSLFSDNIAIYDVNNNGGWYDFGFVLGTGSLGTIIRLIVGKKED